MTKTPCQQLPISTADLLFFENNNEPYLVEQAKALCDKCPIRQECLDEALDTKALYGIWGGKTPSERKRIRRSKISSYC